eukprot:superscaffoldBa00000945_g8127
MSVTTNSPVPHGLILDISGTRASMDDKKRSLRPGAPYPAMKEGNGQMVKMEEKSESDKITEQIEKGIG